MIVHPIDENELEKAHLCAKCKQEISDGDTVVNLNVHDVTGQGGGYTYTMRRGIHPTVHYECLSEEDRPIVINNHAAVD